MSGWGRDKGVEDPDTLEPTLGLNQWFSSKGSTAPTGDVRQSQEVTVGITTKGGALMDSSGEKRAGANSVLS